MKIETIGRISGQDVQAVTLTGPGGLAVKVLTYGARLAELWVPDRQGRLADIVLGHDSLEDWLASPFYFGATCGRYANRIAQGRFVLDGVPRQVDCNEGSNHLHGGAAGFDKKIWTLADVSETQVTLTLASADAEMGYPGALDLRCTYRLDKGQLWIEMSAQSDAPTVINMVNHAYFNMAGQGSGDVLGQQLAVAAPFYLPVGDGLIPTGEVRAVRRTAYDFTTLRAIGSPLDGDSGFDHNWCLGSAEELVGARLLRPCAEAVDPVSGRRLRLWTSEPGVQLYIGGYLDDRLPGKAGGRIGRFGGFTLETQRFPDTPNRPHFPTATLRPGQEYRHVMAFDFTC